MAIIDVFLVRFLGLKIVFLIQRVRKIPLYCAESIIVVEKQYLLDDFDNW